MRAWRDWCTCLSISVRIESLNIPRQWPGEQGFSSGILTSLSPTPRAGGPRPPDTWQGGDAAADTDVPASACWSLFVRGRMRWRNGDCVLLLAIPIQLMLSPVPVPTLLDGLDVSRGHSGKTSQRQDRGTDRYPGRSGTMMGLAMRTPHHCRQDLPRAAYVLEGGIQSVTEQ